MTQGENMQWALSAARSRMAVWAVGAVVLAEATGDPNAVWEPFQIEYLNRCEEQPVIAASKSRQIGFSWLMALEAVVRSHLQPGSLTNFVSINRAEAEEKIRYAVQINEACPGFTHRWLTKNRGELETVSGSRILSHACTPPRGLPRANHRLDEIAHYQRPAEIYAAAVPAMLRGGSIAIASSPWVRGGFHYEVMEEQSRYPRFTRMWVPWWECFGLCTDVERAKREAPAMTTADRVATFGTERLKLLCDSMALDAFQVECELAYADDSLAWITWEEIVACTAGEDHDYIIAEGQDQVQQVLPKILGRQYLGPVFAGVDVGRKHDLTVIALLELVGGVLVCFALLVLPKTQFSDQRSLLQELTPVLRGGCIDETGLGANLAEDVARHNAVWSGVTFTSVSKAQIATDLRQAFQDRSIVIPPDRTLQRDLHSVQRIVTHANNIVFDSDREEGQGHADRFWALGLAVNAMLRRMQTYGLTVLKQGPRLHAEPSLEDTIPVRQEPEEAVDMRGRPVERRRSRILRQ